MKHTNRPTRLFAIALLLLAAPALLPATAAAQERIEIQSAPTTAESVESADPTEQEVIRRIPYVNGESPEVGENEAAILNPERTEWRVYRTDEDEGRIKHTLPMLYLEGGVYWMNVITLCLIGMLFAAWKAPR